MSATARPGVAARARIGVAAASRRRIALAMLWAACAAGCPGACAPGPTDEDAARYGDAYARVTRDCLLAGPFLRAAEPVYVDEFLPDLAPARAAVVARFQRAVDDPDVTFQRDAFEACMAFLEAPDVCDTYRRIGDLDDDSRCDEVFIGARRAGALCAEPVQCAPGSTCDGPDDGGCGACVEVGGPGEECGDDLPCAVGLVCGDDSACVPDPSDEAVTAAAGDPCDDATTCGSLYSTGLVCIDGACADVVVADRGEACSAAAARVCRDALTTSFCGAVDGGAATCRARPGLDEPCTTATYTLCDAREAACVTEVCVPPLVEGAACDPAANACRLGTTCDDDDTPDAGGTCRAQLTLDVEDVPPVCD